MSKIAAPISGFLEVIVGSNSLKYGVLLLSTSTSAVAFTTQKLTSFEPWNCNETRTFYQRNLKQNIACLHSTVTLIKGTERLLCFVCCWFPISVYKYQVLPLAVTIQLTATEQPHWEEQQTCQILKWQAEITVALSCICLSAVSAGFTFTKRFRVRFLESNWNAATREITVLIAMLLPQTSAFKAVLLTLQLFTCPGKFLGEHAFFYKEEGFFELKSSARTTEDLH